MDKYKNIYQVASPKDGSYIKLELDISAVDGTPAGKARLNVYRAGYKDTDDPSKPFKTFDISPGLIHNANKNAEHVIGFRSTFGQIALSIDGKTNFTGAAEPAGQPAFPPRPQPNEVNLNPAGSGADYLAFGHALRHGLLGRSRPDRRVPRRHRSQSPRPEQHPLPRESFRRPVHRYLCGRPQAGLRPLGGRRPLRGDGRRQGVFLVRDPSRNSAPMLRTTFKTPAKAIESARLYVTARGIYEVFLNGKRVGDDHYNPGLTQYNVTHLYQTYDVTSMVQGRRQRPRRHARRRLVERPAQLRQHLEPLRRPPVAAGEARHHV